MKEWIEKNKKIIYYISFAIIGVGFILTRLWRLDELPYGLHVDEAGMAYDAWCLANFGVDRWLKSWPVYLANYGSGQSSLYAFLCAGLFKLFGKNVWMIRLPAVCFSALTLVFGIKLARRIFEDNGLMTWLVGAMITFCPYFVMQSRIGLDCNLMLGSSTVFLYFFITAIEDKKVAGYFISGIAGGIMLYTYALSYIILPVFLLIAMVYVIVKKRFVFKNWVAMAVPMGIIATPLILCQLIRIFDWEEMHFGIFTITKLPYYRAGEIGKFKISNVLLMLKHTFIGDNLLFDSITGICNLYAVTVIFFIIGLCNIIWILFKHRANEGGSGIVFLLLWFLSVLFLGGIIETRTYRINAVFFATVMIAVWGIYALNKYKYFTRIIVGVILVYMVCTARFGRFYFVEYTDATFPLTYFGTTFEEAVDVIEGDEVLKNKLTFVSELGIYYALGCDISPYELDIRGDEKMRWRNYWFSSLQEISDDCNYIVYGNFDEYCEELRQAGFTEERYRRYTFYYKK